MTNLSGVNILTSGHRASPSLTEPHRKYTDRLIGFPTA